MTGYEAAAFAQWAGALVFLVMGVIAIRLGRWTLAGLGVLMGTFFLRVGFITWSRHHGEIDIIGWLAQPHVIFVHSLVIAVLGAGIVIELIIREWGR